MSFELHIDKIHYKHTNQKFLFYMTDQAFIRSSQFWGIIAPNGYGKSHLLQILAGLKRQSQGTIFFNKQALLKLDPLYRSKFLGILLQHEDRHHLYISVENYLNLGLYNQNVSDFLKIEMVDKILNIFQLFELKKRQVCDLSGGEFQRLRIAQLVLQNPSIYLLDEPFNAIDPAMQHVILDYLHNEIKQHHKTVIMITHDILSASINCDHMITIESDGLLRFLPKETVLNKNYLENLFNTEFYPISIKEKNYLVPIGSI